MSSVDLDALLQDVDPASPCGPNLEYDPEFLELEQAVIGKPEVQYGNTVTPAVPPEWKVVKKLANGLLSRSRDLRVVIPLLRSLLALEGMPGLADSLTLIERLLDQRWDSVHPQLDPDDDNDPMLRINSLSTLADTATVLKELKESTLIMLPGLGPLSLRMLEIGSGETPPPEGVEKVAMSSIDAAIGDVDQEKVVAAAAVLSQAFTSAVNIEALLVRQVGTSQALNLGALTKNLRRARDYMQENVKVEEVAVHDEPGAAGEAGAGGGGSGGARGPAAGISGEISNRTDVLKMLDKIVKYYQQYEPSSPVPLLLERTKRLVPKSFLEIMEDLAPDGMNQLNVIRGPQSDGQDG